jgi:hypothetical protein
MTGQPIRATTPEQEDQENLAWLRKQLGRMFGSEKGYGRTTAKKVITRFAELIKMQPLHQRVIDAIDNSNKMAMTQIQFAQNAIHGLERQIALLTRERQQPALANGDDDEFGDEETDDATVAAATVPATTESATTKKNK